MSSKNDFRIFLLFLLFSLALTGTAGAQEAASAGENPEGASSPVVFLGNKSLPPMIYERDGRFVGLVVDLANAIAREMPRPVVLRYMDWTAAQRLVRSGRADALLQINATPDRKKFFDFSSPLLQSEFSIFVPQGAGDIFDVDSLRGKRVGVEAQGYPIDRLRRDPGIRLTVMRDIPTGFDDLAAGKLDAVVVDRQVGTYVLAERNIRNVRIAGDPMWGTSSAIAVGKGRRRLLAQINRAIARMRADGTYQRILSKWEPQEVVFQTREQFVKRRIISLVALFGVVVIGAFSLALLYEAKKRRRMNQRLEREIENRRTAEARLEKYIDIINKNVISITLAADKTIADVSAAFCRAGGYAAEALLGKDCGLLLPDGSGTVLAGILRAADANGEGKGVLRCSKRNGDGLWLATSISPSKAAGGESGGYTCICQDISAQKRIEKLSITDALTELFNRMKIEKVLADEIARSRRYGNNLTLAIIDVDHFKRTNDTYGHQVGDEVLRAFARILRENVRETDSVGRWGGEEFLLVCPQTDLAGGETLIEKLRRRIAAYPFPRTGRQTASFGIAAFREGDTEETLVNHADRALYHAKKNGRNRVSSFPEDAISAAD